MKKQLLCVSEVFKSFQGETSFIGKSSLFVRFFGCNRNCDFCDEKHKDKKKKQFYTVEELVSVCKTHLSEISCVTITGGEPLLQVPNIFSFIEELLSVSSLFDVSVILQTNGDFNIPEKFIENRCFFSVVSPKDLSFKQMCGHELNVVFTGENQKFIKEIMKLSTYKLNFEIYTLTPQDNNPKLISQCKELLSKYRRWRLGIQMHKVYSIK